MDPKKTVYEMYFSPVNTHPILFAALAASTKPALVYDTLNLYHDVQFPIARPEGNRKKNSIINFSISFRETFRFSIEEKGMEK